MIAVLAGCATYRIAPGDDAGYDPPGPDVAIVVTRENDSPEGFQCFEPMLYVLSIGIIPAHCVDTYVVAIPDSMAADTSRRLTVFTVTSIQGWVALLLAPLPDWRYGYGRDIPAEIASIVRRTGQ